MIKIRDGYQIRKILDRDVVTADPGLFNGIIKLNETGALIWNGIAEGKTAEEIAARICEEYDTTMEKAVEDVNVFVRDLTEKGVFEEC